MRLRSPVAAPRKNSRADRSAQGCRSAAARQYGRQYRGQYRGRIKSAGWCGPPAVRSCRGSTHGLMEHMPGNGQSADGRCGPNSSGARPSLLDAPECCSRGSISAQGRVRASGHPAKVWSGASSTCGGSGRRAGTRHGCHHALHHNSQLDSRRTNYCTAFGRCCLVRGRSFESRPALPPHPHGCVTCCWGTWRGRGWARARGSRRCGGAQ